MGLLPWLLPPMSYVGATVQRIMNSLMAHMLSMCRDGQRNFLLTQKQKSDPQEINALCADEEQKKGSGDSDDSPTV
jgi:hypothetical protein